MVVKPCPAMPVAVEVVPPVGSVVTARPEVLKVTLGKNFRMAATDLCAELRLGDVAARADAEV